MKKIITISREFGSGGHDIGMEVAKRLDIPFYDHEIVDKAVAESGFTKEFVEEHGEYSSLSSVLLGTSAPFDSYYYAEDPQDKIFKIQRRIITKFAQEGPCVIVGRCANYVLMCLSEPILRREWRMYLTELILREMNWLSSSRRETTREEYIIASILRENGAITTITT